MTEKRFVYYEHKGADYILEEPNTDLDFIEMLGDTLDAEEITDSLNELYDENKKLKSELRIYRKIASCQNCKHHNYDWAIDDGYGGEEYDVCDKGNDISDDICEDWVEL